MPKTKLRIAVVGGGIVGIAAALMFAQKEFADVTLIAPEHNDVTGDVPITLWARGLSILRSIFGDTYDDVFSASTTTPNSSIVFTSPGKSGHVRIALPQGAAIFVSKNSLHSALSKVLEAAPVTCHHASATKISKGNTCTHQITTQDGTTHEYDLIVMAIGRKAITAKEMSPHRPIPEPFGSVSMTPVVHQPFSRETHFELKDQLVRVQFPQTSFAGAYAMTYTGNSTISRASAPATIPLITYDALDWAGDTIITVGDADHTITPLFGMGVLMGLINAAYISESLQPDVKHPIARSYQQKDRLVTRIVHRIRIIEILVLAPTKLLRVARSLLMRLANGHLLNIYFAHALWKTQDLPNT